jgi:hypothetical protein
MDPNTDYLVYNVTEVFTALVHGYYYIHPGKDTMKFLNKIDGILNAARKYAKNMYNKTKNGIPYEEWIWGKIASEALIVMRSMFNERTFNYFKAQMKDDMEVTFTDKLLEYYLYFLDMQELKKTFEGIFAFKESNNFFISDENYELMMKEFEDCCILIAKQEADNETDFKEHVEYIKATPLAFFDYLCRETIIEIIYSYIDIDPILLAHMIKAYIYTESTNTAADYMAVAATAMYVYDIDVFNPSITDVDKIDANRSQAFYRNKVGNFMMVQV